MTDGTERLKIERSLDETFVTFNDRELLDNVSLRELEHQLLDLASDAKRSSMLLNFSEVEFMSSSFLGLLTKIQKRIREKAGELTLINIDPKLLKVFQITNLDKVFKIV